MGRKALVERPQAVVKLLLARGGSGAYMSEIRDILSCSYSAVAIILERLRAKGLVDSRDGAVIYGLRRQVYFLTEKGVMDSSAMSSVLPEERTAAL